MLLSTHPYLHNDVMAWTRFPHHQAFVERIHQSPVDAPHKEIVCGSLWFLLLLSGSTLHGLLWHFWILMKRLQFTEFYGQILNLWQSTDRVKNLSFSNIQKQGVAMGRCPWSGWWWCVQSISHWHGVTLQQLVSRRTEQLECRKVWLHEYTEQCMEQWPVLA